MDKTKETVAAEQTTVEVDQGRRKAVKVIVGGMTAMAAYHVLPEKWGVPVIEQVFLPAHAAASGSVERSYRSTEHMPEERVFCLTISGDTATFSETETGHGGAHRGSGSADGVIVCTQAGDDTTLEVTIVSANDTKASISIHVFTPSEDFGMYSFTLPRISGAC